MEKRVQSLTQHIKTVLDTEPLPWYAVSMMKVGDLVRLRSPGDEFDGYRGLIIRTVEGNTFKDGFHYEIQTFTGHVLLALSFELEKLENEYYIPV